MSDGEKMELQLGLGVDLVSTLQCIKTFGGEFFHAATVIQSQGANKLVHAY